MLGVLLKALLKERPLNKRREEGEREDNLNLRTEKNKIRPKRTASLKPPEI